jgi:hypothetical protein
MTKYTHLQAWFKGRSEDADDRAREEAARMLEMDEPMAGAGALLSGTRRKSETERAAEIVQHLEESDERKLERAKG